MNLLFKIVTFFYALVLIPAWRWDWYKLRKEQGHAISLRRAFFGKFPRFGVYEYNELGCPEYNKRDYEAVMDAKDL